MDHIPPLVATEEDPCGRNVPDTVSFMDEEDMTLPNNTKIKIIDNTTLIYIPVTLPCGVRTQCSPEVLSSCPMVLRTIQTDLMECFKLLPWSVHALVHRTTIWINASYSYGPKDDPRFLRHSTAHHQEGWLLHW